MTLVSYSDSDSDNSDETEPEKATEKLVRAASDSSESKKRKRDNEDQEKVTEARKSSKLPPLPQIFYNQYATSVRTHASDDPELHGGRTRQVPHVEGNWPTHIYLEWHPESEDLTRLESLVRTADATGKVHSLLVSELGVQQPLHVSLSVPLVLQTEQKDSFEELVKERIQKNAMGAIKLRFDQLRWEPNMDRTRWFLVLTFRRQPTYAAAMNQLLDCCNRCALAFDLPTLYAEMRPPQNLRPSSTRAERGKVFDCFEAFHISIAWQLFEPKAEEKAMLAHPRMVSLDNTTITFDVVKLKIGNVVKEIRLDLYRRE